MLSSSGGTEEANRQRTISTVSSAATATTSAAAGPIVGPLHRFLQFNAALSPSRAAKDGEEKQPEVGNELETLLYWRSLVSSTFAPESLLKFKLYNSESRQEVKNMGTYVIGMHYLAYTQTNLWHIEVHYSLLPRFLLINYQSGISAIRYLLLNPAERPVGQGAILDVPSTNIIYHFGSGFKVISEGHLRVHYNSQLLITLMEFNTTSFAEYIPRDLFRSENGDVISIPDSPVNEFGLTLKAMRCLEVCYLYDAKWRSCNWCPIHKTDCRGHLWYAWINNSVYYKTTRTQGLVKIFGRSLVPAPDFCSTTAFKCKSESTNRGSAYGSRKSKPIFSNARVFSCADPTTRPVSVPWANSGHPSTIVFKSVHYSIAHCTNPRTTTHVPHGRIYGCPSFVLFSWRTLRNSKSRHVSTPSISSPSTIQSSSAATTSTTHSSSHDAGPEHDDAWWLNRPNASTLLISLHFLWKHNPRMLHSILYILLLCTLKDLFNR